MNKPTTSATADGAVAQAEPDNGSKAPARLKAANAVLELFTGSTRLHVMPTRGVIVTWETHGGKLMSRRWQVRSGQSFYPVWSLRWAHGGTACTALSQLVRWIREQPVLPLNCWRWWCGPTVALGRDRGPKMLEILAAAGYPDHQE